MAHHLKRVGQSVTLCLRGSTQDFPGEIVIEKYDKVDKSNEFALEELGKEYSTRISILIVSTKAYSVAEAVKRLSSRLDPTSTIVLLNNGMGIQDELMQVFPDENQRPGFITGVLSHGCWRKSRYHIVHASNGYFYISGDEKINSVKSTMDVLLSLKELDIKKISFEEMQIRQLEKLTINACMNSITALTLCRNGYVEGASDVMSDMCAEASAVFEPYLKSLGVENSLSHEKLFSIVMDTTKAAAANKSSMLQDMLARRPTEIDYINGFITSLGRRYNIPTKVNDTIARLVKFKSSLPVQDI